jgi:hypothetical protein
MKDFNTAEFAWKDIELVMLGRPLVRIVEVSYKVKREKKHIYGRGSKPLGVQKGNYMYEGQITIGQSELEALIRKMNDPLSRSFDIDMAYRIEGDTTIVRDRIVGVDITEFEKAMKQGDLEMQIKLPFVALNIKYNV